MAHSRRHLLWQASLLVTGLICGGCAANAPVERPLDLSVPPEFQPGAELLVMSESHIDSLNRYLSTVAITTVFHVPGVGAEVRTCSGALIHSRVVLTAGHCVCHERKAIPPEASGTRVLDRATCAKTSTVRFIRYETETQAQQDPRRVEAGELPFELFGPYVGRVQAHEDLRILYEEVETEAGVQASAQSSVADLALIILPPSMPDLVKPAKLAEEPVRLKERVLMAGYGAASSSAVPQEPVRRHGGNEVISIREDGATFYVGKQYEIEPVYRGEKPGVFRARGSYTERGDSGGPCFRERKGSLELVGIAKSTLSPPVVLSSYTSVPKYLDWIRQRLEEADASN